MNTWSYQILITALFGLTAFMIYARFASRSREKSLHHAPSELTLPRFEAETPAAPLADFAEGLPPEEGADPFVMGIKPLPVPPASEEEKKSSAKSEDTYFDELQEAAAGLAMLMRSSPARERSTPVVFAPEAEESQGVMEESGVVDANTAALSAAQDEAGDGENCLQEVVSDEVSEAERIDGQEAVVAVEELASVRDESFANEVTSDAVTTEDVSSLSEAMEKVEALLDGPAAFAESRDRLAVAEVAESDAPGSLAVVLGEEVAERFARLDSGLDELESIIVGIEGRLVLLEEFVAAPIEEEISEAA